MPQQSSLSIMLDGVPVQLGGRAEQMVRAVIEKQDEIETLNSGTLELCYGRSNVEAYIREKVGFWKVN